MDQLTCMRSFVRAVETESFSAVARELGISQPTVSKQIASLEEQVGVRLMSRSTRSLTLTDDGQRYYEHALAALEAVAAANASVGEPEKPSGTLRVSCPVTFGQVQIVPRIGAFLDRCPEVDVELRMSDQFVDLIEEGIDVAVRAGRLADSGFVARRIGTTRRVTVATPEYIARAGEPRVPADLVEHDCVIYTGLRTLNEWRFEGPKGEVGVKVSGRLRINNTIATRDAILQSIGIGVVPIWLFSEEIASGRVVILLADYEPTAMPIHALYPGRRLLPAKTRAFVDFLAESLADCGQMGANAA